MGPSPFGKHQRIVFNLASIMRQYVVENDLGEVFLSPLDVIFEDSTNRLQPDIIFIRKANMAIFQDWIRGVPDMVCEVVSPGTYRKDTAVKREIYERYRVAEYWIVIPELLTFEILTLEDNKYITHSVAELEGVVESKVIDGLKVNIRDIFSINHNV
ncbi:MAG: Uma2 family endonuclease [Candidatus Magnetominusculus sp. LBB02]|nr:Uma2 family endonuclease [Candidatus Magnetominusculus sp. LBB02]